MAYANGHLPNSALTPIPGNGQLRNDAARAYTAMHSKAKGRGVSLVLIEGPIRRTYRPLAAQQLAWSIYQNGGNLAARPGTSNHGWGIAVDLMSMTQRAMVDRIGAAFGWAKRWSDAPSEWWHLRFNDQVAVASAGPRTIRKGSSGATVKQLQRLLRARGFKSLPGRGKRGYGYFGRTTVSAVKRFQRAHNLKPDGIVGSSTWRKLGRS